MPASICDPVSNALRLSINADESQSSSLLDSRLYSSSKNVLLSKIEFEESGDYQSNVLDGLKSKYVVIRPKKQVLDSKIIKKETSSSSQASENNKNGEDGLPKPKRVLYPVEKVRLGWQSAWSAGAGMQNVGNTCYLNSTLQALFHVPALANWLMSESSHVEQCNQQEACVICGMRATLLATQKSGGNPIKPWQVYSKLRLICRHLTPGRQEDAHEFLRYLVEAMEKCYLSRFMNADKLDQYSKETTPLNQILGGYLRSTVRCLACHHLSTTYQHFQDLLLDIRKHSTLDEALDSFFSRERLEDLGYKCEACNKKVSATKQFFIERAPMVLCIALKRFSLAGGKLSKHIQFRKKICLNKYLYSKNNQQQLSYKLVSLVTHLGPSQNCGHYTAIGQAPNNTYMQFDDSCVRPLPLSAVLATNAYIMFFERDPTPFEPQSPIPCTSTSTSPAVYGPQLPDNFLNRDKNPLKLAFRSSDQIKPLILNSTLNRASEPCKPEPWVVKQNGEVVKVSNGTERSKQDDKRVNFVIKRPVDDDHSPVKSKLVKSDSGTKNSESKLVRPQKSPLEKLEEQMNKSDLNQRNGSSKLVPYDSESSGDERETRGDLPKPSRCSGTSGLVVTTTGMQRGWVVSRENSMPLLSPSRNGVTIKQVKEKEASPNTSVSSMSPASDADSAPQQNNAPLTPISNTNGVKPGGVTGQLETARYLQPLSHRGYGAPVASWTGGQSNMSRQVFEERREERKRAMEAADEMDRGRNKKVKKYPHFHNNRFHNNRNYNPFQEKQNKVHWNGSGGGNGGYNKYRGDRRPPHHFAHKHHNKHRRFNRYNNNNNNNGNHYNRH